MMFNQEPIFKLLINKIEDKSYMTSHDFTEVPILNCYIERPRFPTEKDIQNSFTSTYRHKNISPETSPQHSSKCSPKKKTAKMMFYDENSIFFQGVKQEKHFYANCAPGKLVTVLTHAIADETLKRDVLTALSKKLEHETMEDSEKYLLKLVGALIDSVSSEAYNILSKLIPAYSKRDIERFVESMKQDLQKWITDTGYIKNIILQTYPGLEKDHKMLACLAGDGCSIVDDKEKGILYCFELLPLSGKYNVAPIHFAFNMPSKPMSSEDLRNKFRAVIQEIEKCNIKVMFIATDGETATNVFHTNFFKNIDVDKNFDDLVDANYKECLFGKTIIPISDLLHILKNARAHLLNHLLFVDPSHLICVNLSIMRQLNNSATLNDMSTQAKMKDGLALDLFLWHTYIKLLQNARYEAAFFVLPFVLLNESMRSTSLSVEDRLKFIEGAFQIFRFHLKQIQENNNPAITQKYKHSSIGTFIGSEIWIKRSINTCIAIAVGIKLQINGVISDLHLGRLSSRL